MRVLGAILAGGAARRFGSDKAHATLQGIPLIEHVAAAIGPQVDAIVLCGRTPGLDDRPAGVGPLGGIAAALAYGEQAGFDRVLTVPCDAPLLPGDLVASLRRGDVAAFVDRTPVIGLWPTSLSTMLDAYLARGEDRSIRAWARAIAASAVTLRNDIPNVNTPADLRALQ